MLPRLGPCALVTALVVTATSAHAQPSPPVAHRSLAVSRLEPLGLDAERAARLEALFRVEVERLAGLALPPVADMDRALLDPKLRGCTGAPACLADLGGRLGVEEIIAGTIGELGTSYVIDVKLVDVATRAELRRVSTPLAGTPDDLIEAVRVAAHQLLAPEAVRGGLQVEADTPGATVKIDGRAVGTTPLARPIAGLTLGPHDVVVEKAGARTIATKIEVRFQKTTQLVVGLEDLTPASSPQRPGRRRGGTPAWRWVAFGAAGVALGVGLGLLLAGGGDELVTCAEEPAACMR